MAHFVSSFTVALLGFLIVLLLHRLNRMHCSVSMITFFALAFGAAWEILEFSVDHLFGTHLKSGLDDTMYELISDGVSGLVVAGAGMLWLPSHDEAVALSARHEGQDCDVSAGR